MADTDTDEEENLNKIISSLKEIERLERITLLKRECSKIIKYITDMLDNHPKYVFSDDCSDNMDLYFKLVNETLELQNPSKNKKQTTF